MLITPNQDLTKQDLVFRPRQEVIHSAQISAFQLHIEKKYGLKFDDYFAFQGWTVEHFDHFWSDLADYFNIDWLHSTQVEGPRFRVRDAAHPLLSAEFFPGTQLNYAWEIFRRFDYHANKAVLITYDELRGMRPLTARDLWSKVSRVVDFFKTRNLVAGDRVAAFVTNGEEALVYFLASARLGLIFSSCSPDFGAEGVFERFSQIEPRILLACLGYSYSGKEISTLDTIRDVVNRIPSIQTLVLYDHSKNYPSPVSSDQFRADLKFWNYSETSLIEISSEFQAPRRSDFYAADFRHPIAILYSSGTTGKPKCIVHGTGGVLLQHIKEHALHCDLKQSDTMLYFTTCGWMMWNWMVSALAQGATIVAYDGSVAFPDPEQLWKVVSECKVSVMGTSPKYLGHCQKQGLEPTVKYKFDRLRLVLSTGSPLVEEHYSWFYQRFSEVHLASISGGTDLVSCFMLGVPTLKVYKGQIQAVGLGMAVECWNDLGKDVVGQRGELVCVKPFVSMPIGFWNDPERKAYFKAYFEHFSDAGVEVWRHGDYIEVDPVTRGIIVHGRSDATLNPGGVRIGTAELYQQVEKLPEIEDCIAASYHEKGEAHVWLFVVLRENHTLDDKLTKQIRLQIKAQLTPRHVPDRIFQVQKIPYTRSGKKLETAVSAVLNGREILNLQAFHDISALDDFRQIAASHCRVTDKV